MKNLTQCLKSILIPMVAMSALSTVSYACPNYCQGTYLVMTQEYLIPQGHTGRVVCKPVRYIPNYPGCSGQPTQMGQLNDILAEPYDPSIDYKGG